VSLGHKHNAEPQDGDPDHGLPQAWPAADAVLRSDVAFQIADRSRVRLLDGLSKPDQDSILAAASYRRFSVHSTVTNQEEPADQLFLLIKGSACYCFITPEGRKIYLLWLAPGEIFGGASLLAKPSSYLVGTETIKDSCMLVWERKTIRSLAARYPRVLENGLAIATDYLTWYLASHLGLLCHTARQRLAHVLVSLANGIGRKCPNGIQLDITNEQLANTANITLFTASRLLSEWQRSGAVAKSRGRVVLFRPERLFLS
jgi:CRP/FNR family transcriptional regulator, nitrogen oxide reductase regulator